MNEPTIQSLRGPFVGIAISLVLWLSACGAVWSSPSVESATKHFVVAGMIMAALLQYWAYYNLYQRAEVPEKN